MLDISILILIVTALGTVVKKLGIPKKFLPLTNLFLGIICAVAFLSENWQENLFMGIIIGLSACGLFDHTKITKK